MFCKTCNTELNGQRYCPNCGTDNMVQPQQPSNGYQPYNAPQQPSQFTPYQPYQQQGQYVAPPANPYLDPGESKATTSLVFGILSLFLSWLFGIPAIIFANKYESIGNGMNSSKAKAGKIMGIISIVFGAIAIVYLIFMLLAIGSMY